mmetsp:Transcript_8128/g.13699  ORF Transcript_8128/g.13699 Transcript_8128/m.13699 type:complete len:202 (+) Transcript_8128:364-969(+)
MAQVFGGLQIIRQIHCGPLLVISGLLHGPRDEFDQKDVHNVYGAGEVMPHKHLQRAPGHCRIRSGLQLRAGGAVPLLHAAMMDCVHFCFAALFFELLVSNPHAVQPQDDEDEGQIRNHDQQTQRDIELVVHHQNGGHGGWDDCFHRSVACGFTDNAQYDRDGDGHHHEGRHVYLVAHAALLDIGVVNMAQDVRGGLWLGDL